MIEVNNTNRNAEGLDGLVRRLDAAEGRLTGAGGCINPNWKLRNFLGGPGADSTHSKAGGLCSVPGQGSRPYTSTKDPTCCNQDPKTQCSQINKEIFSKKRKLKSKENKDWKINWSESTRGCGTVTKCVTHSGIVGRKEREGNKGREQ